MISYLGSQGIKNSTEGKDERLQKTKGNSKHNRKVKWEISSKVFKNNWE
jgi:hypothetical protein